MMRVMVLKEEDDDFYLIDGIFEGADSSGHVVRDDPVQGTGDDEDDEDDGNDDGEGEDGSVDGNVLDNGDNGYK